MADRIVRVIKTIFCVMFGLVALLSVHADPTSDPATTPSTPPAEAITLWPGVAPGETGDIGAEINRDAAKGRVRVTNVTNPTITIYHPAPEKDTGTSVMICPGGAYAVLAMDIEGDAVRRWLNSMGVTAIVLKYRVPRREGREKHAAPLEDAQRAMGLLRLHAKEWKINPDRLGVIGFSAGGHLGAMLSTSFEQRPMRRSTRPTSRAVGRILRC